MAYLLDANVFMAASNLHYGMDFCPAFWDWLVREHASGKVFSVEKVGDEIAAGDDELAKWAQERGVEFFVPPDGAAVTGLGTVATWVNGHQTYTAAAKNTFLQIADYYLVAQALGGRHVVVTHEKPENSAHRVKIPNVCMGVQVKHMTPFEMLRRERARFVLGRQTE
ncbi:MAG: DUF4411 family protein [Planctomycetes bacterium]|nr:DUF4411 family protein [Planctomycetota bacterium]